MLKDMESILYSFESLKDKLLSELANDDDPLDEIKHFSEKIYEHLEILDIEVFNKLLKEDEEDLLSRLKRDTK
jgi:hypothetical protein